MQKILRTRSVALTMAMVLSLLCAVYAHNVQAASACDLNATTSNFSAQVSAATTGQTVCLATGNYGTWTGTNKAITIKAAASASPVMDVNLGSTASGFTIDGMKGMGGIVTSSKNVTIKNSDFSSSIDFEGNNTNFTLDGNTLDWNAASGGINSKIFFDVANNGTLAAPAVTIKNNHIANGELDGVHTGGKGLLIVDNIFDNLCDVGLNHTDNIQFEGGSQTRIAGNYIHASKSCATQGITSFDSGTVGIIVENNVVDIPRDWGIEFYSDKDSIIRHNTVVWHSASYSEFNTGTGQIDIDRKSQDPAGTGTHVYDNIASVGFSNGSSGTQDHNISGQSVTYVGGVNPTTFAGFALSAGSTGKNAASDGTDVGIAVTSGGGGSTTATYHAADLSNLLSHYGRTTSQTVATGDLNGDGAVNVYDLGKMLADYSP